MLHLIQINFSIAAGTSEDYLQSTRTTPSPAPSEDGMFLLRRSQTLFRTLADESDKGRKERGFLMGLLEIARECRRRGWKESEQQRSISDKVCD